MQQTISQAAQLYGKARSTIHRAIDAGRLSCSVRGDGVRVIQLAELIRLWGEPPNAPPETQQNATPPDDDAQQPQQPQQAILEELRAMRRELVALREEVAELRRLPAPGQIVSHPDDDQPRQDESLTAGRSAEEPSPVERDADKPPVRSFADLLDKLNARSGN